MGELKAMDTSISSSSCALPMLQVGYQHATDGEVRIDEKTLESKRSRELFDSENDMDVDIVRNDNRLNTGEEYDNKHARSTQPGTRHKKITNKQGNTQRET